MNRSDNIVGRNINWNGCKIMINSLDKTLNTYRCKMTFDKKWSIGFSETKDKWIWSCKCEATDNKKVYKVEIAKKFKDMWWRRIEVDDDNNKISIFGRDTDLIMSYVGDGKENIWDCRIACVLIDEELFLSNTKPTESDIEKWFKAVNATTE